MVIVLEKGSTYAVSQICVNMAAHACSASVGKHNAAARYTFCCRTSALYILGAPSNWSQNGKKRKTALPVNLNEKKEQLHCMYQCHSSKSALIFDPQILVQDGHIFEFFPQ